MYLTEISNLPSFSRFGVRRKPSVSKNFDLIAQSLDENLLRRLKALASSLNPPKLSLSWLSLAVDFLSSVHAEARNLISNLKLPASDDSLARYLDESVKLLDVCNLISLEIERLRERRLLMKFVLHLLETSGDGGQLPAPEKLRRAKESLSDSEKSTRRIRGGLQKSPEVLIADLASRIVLPQRSKVSGVGKLLHHAIYAVGSVTVFVSSVLVSALYGHPDLVSIRVPSEFVWARALTELESAIQTELEQRVGSGRRGSFEELADVEACGRRLQDLIADVTAGHDDKKEALTDAVKEMTAVTEEFSGGLDGLGNGVDGLFRTVLCVRNGVMGNYGVGDEKQDLKSKDARRKSLKGERKVDTDSNPETLYMVKVNACNFVELEYLNK